MRMMLDASAIIAFLRNEPGADVVDRILRSSEYEKHVHALNVIEVQYKLAFGGGDIEAAKAVEQFLRLPVKVHEKIDKASRKRICFFKERYPFLSLGDCVCIANAARIDAVVLTSDRPFMNIDPSDAKISLIR